MRSFRATNRVGSALFCLVFFAASGKAGDIKGKVTTTGISSAKSIVVYIDAIPGKTFDPPNHPVVMDQKHMTFIPHVLVVAQGTTVDFLNSDATQHNVFWPNISGNKKLAGNLGTWPQGQKKSFTFKNVGAAPLLCNVHSEMSGYVVVVPTSYFAVTDSAGDYEIKNVPAGHYTLKTWSEEGKPTTQSVEVPSSTTTVNLTVRR